MSKENIKHFKLVNNSSIKTYLGYVRRRYNSYTHGTPDAPLNTSGIFSGCISYLDKNTEKLIKLNQEKINPFKLSKGLHVNELITKKLKSWNLVSPFGVTIHKKGLDCLLDCSGIVYKFEIESLRDENLKDGIYTNCVITLSKGNPYITFNKLKYRSFSKYISRDYLEYKKSTELKKIHKIFFKKTIKLKKSKVSSEQLKTETANNSREYIMDLIRLMKNLSQTYCNLDNKTKIPEMYNNYINLKKSNSENQAVAFLELKFQILQEFGPCTDDEMCLKTLIKLLN